METQSPDRIENARVLVAVKTYPQPHTSHGETVCTAGVFENGSWVRIHPVPFQSEEYKRFSKYQWIQVTLKKHRTDKRPESYSPSGEIRLQGKINTKACWRERRKFVLKQIYYSFNELIYDAYNGNNRSLAVVKPSEIIDFEWEETDRQWPESWQNKWRQNDFFSQNTSNTSIVKKVPYKFFYKFRTIGDDNPRRVSVIDWEVGKLYWNCVKKSEGDESTALQKVKQKCYDYLAVKKDLHFIVGTSFIAHIRKWENPFMIIGLFYPSHESEEIQLTLPL